MKWTALGTADERRLTQIEGSMRGFGAKALGQPPRAGMMGRLGYIMPFLSS
jgi:hypothetical protein